MLTSPDNQEATKAAKLMFTLRLIICLSGICLPLFKEVGCFVLVF